MSKSDSIWYPRYVGDYRRKTSHLSLLEHGAYTLLLDHYYSTGRPLPANGEQLHRICSAIAADEQAAVQRIITQFFVLKDGAYHNSKADDELLKRSNISEKRRKAANEKYAKAPANGQQMEVQLDTHLQPHPHLHLEPHPSEKVIVAFATPNAADAVIIYNQAASKVGWPECQKLTPARKSKLAARLRDCGGLEGWTAAMEKATSSKFLTGDSKRGKDHQNWKPDIDFFIREEKFTQLMEGKYDGRTDNPNSDDDLRRQVLEGSGLAPGMDGGRWPA